MKKNKVIFAFSIAMFLMSCATTDTETSEVITEPSDEQEIETVIEEPVPEPPSISETFYQTLMDTDFILQSSPKRTSVGKAFSGNYVIKVTDAEGNPKKDFPMTVSYPSSRTGSAIVNATENLVSDEGGLVTFTAPVPAFPGNTVVTFYATPDPTDVKSAQIALDFSVEAPWEVRSTTVYKMGVLYVWDLNEKGNPTSNSTAILSEFRNRGISAGNAPVSDSSYINRSLESIYKANKEILEGSGVAYLISGKVEFVKPVYEEDGQQVCELRAPLTCVDMKNGNILYETTVTSKATGKTYWYAVENCKTELAKKFVDAVIYGM